MHNRVINGLIWACSCAKSSYQRPYLGLFVFILHLLNLRLLEAVEGFCLVMVAAFGPKNDYMPFDVKINETQWPPEASKGY